ncbi:hypothetical protein AMELA_G00157010 [Ameiurus melas]|uniref:SCP domain-containing protein n=1 Tax=Ameiurus melas TaxID=219545 RepID=A0A7J6ADW1_AMEME|nr:hypothetical protein AMELA_G00157010 [Ameiurus melas]
MSCTRLHPFVKKEQTAPRRQGEKTPITSFTAMADESFKTNFLDKHNEYRKKHGTPALTISQDLCSSAQAWADHLLSIKTLKHSETDNGENIYYFQSSAPKTLVGDEPVDNWYSEIKDYDFSKPGDQPKTGHFTQVVWKASKSLGVGVATDGTTFIVVGQYEPAGNITNEGYYKDNVLPEGDEPVDNWYSEIKDYDFSKPGDQPKTGHFTQVVWKASKSLGVGVATDGTTFIVVGRTNLLET